MTLLCLCPPTQPDLRAVMDYVNNASNSYGSGDAMSSSLANMSIGDQHQNGVQSGHDVKMKGQRASGVCVLGGGGGPSCCVLEVVPPKRGDVSPDDVTH